jgi:AcrR family transcriptional regulator
VQRTAALGASINNATLYYHFRTEEALIQGVGSRLTAEFKRRRVRPKEPPSDARQELRLEFEDVRQLLRAQPRLFVVLTELALRALRDPAIKKIGDNREDSGGRTFQASYSGASLKAYSAPTSILREPSPPSG